MGIFSRLGTLIKSNLNDVISKAEDPEKMLNQVMLDMQQQLVEAKKQVAIAIADEKRLQRQRDTEVERAADWEKKAILAIRSNDDDLAREALARKQEHDQIAAQYDKSWQAQKSAVDKLKEALRLLTMKIEEAKRRKNLLIARKKRAEAQKTIANTMSGLSDTNTFDTFGRMADKIEQMEAEADANAELSGELSGNDLEARFRRLEASSTAATDDALLQLKQKIGLLAPATTADPSRQLAGASPERAQLALQTAAAPAERQAAAPLALQDDVMREMEELDRQLEEAAKQAAALDHAESRGQGS